MGLTEIILLLLLFLLILALPAILVRKSWLKKRVICPECGVLALKTLEERICLKCQGKEMLPIDSPRGFKIYQQHKTKRRTSKSA